MARPISYDPAAPLERAVDLFWTRGYQALSVDDIVREGQEQGDFRRDMPAAALASVLAVGFMAPLILPADEARNRAFLAILG